MSDVSTPQLPPDDANRRLALAKPDSDSSLRHISVVGDTYTILISGQQTAGRYALIDMYVPPGGGPPPHRHDFEEMFYVLEGEVEITFRGVRSIAHAGETVNIPANAPHAFKNVSSRPARLHCMVSPAGAEEVFSGDWAARRHAHFAPAKTQRSRTNGTQGEDEGVGGEIRQ